VSDIVEMLRSWSGLTWAVRDEAADEITRLRAENERIEQQAWEEALRLVRGTNADMCKTGQQAYRIIHKAINDAVNKPKLRTLQGRVAALQETGDE